MPNYCGVPLQPCSTCTAALSAALSKCDSWASNCTEAGCGMICLVPMAMALAMVLFLVMVFECRKNGCQDPG